MVCFGLMRPGDRTPDCGPEHRSFRNIPGWRFIHADFDHRWAQHGAHHDQTEHDEHVMDMNEVRRRASERVQRAGRNVVS